MTTIDHQQAVEAVQGVIPGINVLTAERAFTAAAPHLRAGIAEEVRKLPVPNTDGISDPLPSDWKAAGMAEMKASVLALLEGGGE